MTTGERIKAARKQAGLTQKELGEKLGISYQSIAQWENGLRNPKHKSLTKIAEALNVRLRDLVDSSWLDEYEFEKATQTLTQNVYELQKIDAYLQAIGFTVERKESETCYEIEDELGNVTFIPADTETHLSKEGYTVVFSQSEYEELNIRAREAIEGKFYKKVLEQQRKTKVSADRPPQCPPDQPPETIAEDTEPE